MPSTDFHCTPVCATLRNAQRRTCSHVLTQRRINQMFFLVEDTRKASKFFLPWIFSRSQCWAEGCAVSNSGDDKGYAAFPRWNLPCRIVGSTKISENFWFSGDCFPVGCSWLGPRAQIRWEARGQTWWWWLEGQKSASLACLDFACSLVLELHQIPESMCNNPDRSRVKYHKDWVTKADVSALYPFWLNYTQIWHAESFFSFKLFHLTKRICLASLFDERVDIVRACTRAILSGGLRITASGHGDL